MIICRNCGNEVDEHEIYCHCCSHIIEDGLENYQRSSTNKGKYLNTNKKRVVSILIASTIIACFCTPIIRDYKLKHDFDSSKQSFDTKKNNTIKQVYYIDKNNKKNNQQIQTPRNIVINKIQQKQVSTNQQEKDTGRMETEITSGELFNKITSVVPVKEILVIEDTTVGFKNLNISVNVKKGSTTGELATYKKNVVKIQNNLEEVFLSENYTGIVYVMNVENVENNVYITYKKQDNKYMLESVSMLDEIYKQNKNLQIKSIPI